MEDRTRRPCSPGGGGASGADAGGTPGGTTLRSIFALINRVLPWRTGAARETIRFEFCDNGDEACESLRKLDRRDQLLEVGFADDANGVASSGQFLGLAVLR